VAVASTILLPGQPTAGEVAEVALHGDGYFSPHSEFHVNVQLEADATGGNAVIQIQLDPRWSSVLAWCEIEVASLADAKIVNWRLVAGPALAFGINQTVTALTGSVVGTHAPALWVPPPQLLVGPSRGVATSLTLTTDNTDTEDLNLSCVFLNYQKDVRNRVSTSVINMPFSRGSSGTAL